MTELIAKLGKYNNNQLARECVSLGISNSRINAHYDYPERLYATHSLPTWQHKTVCKDLVGVAKIVMM